MTFHCSKTANTELDAEQGPELDTATYKPDEIFWVPMRKLENGVCR